MIAYYTYDLSSLLLLTALVIAIISDLLQTSNPELAYLSGRFWGD